MFVVLVTVVTRKVIIKIKWCGSHYGHERSKCLVVVVEGEEEVEVAVAKGKAKCGRYCTMTF